MAGEWWQVTGRGVTEPGLQAGSGVGYRRTVMPSAATECPNGNWKVVLTSLTYTDVVLHVQQPPGTDVLTDSLGTIDP